MATIVTCDYCGNRAVARIHIQVNRLGIPLKVEFRLDLDVCEVHAREYRAGLPAKKKED